MRPLRKKSRANARPNLEHADLRPRDAGAAPPEPPEPPPKTEIIMRPVTGADGRIIWTPE